MGTDDAKQIHIKMSQEFHQRIRLRAAYDDLSIQQWVMKILENELDKMEIGLIEKGERS
ncbi:MAG TPA: hypothetical protein PK014_08365 [Thermoanaerobaculia bacterium]|nr:hypothetical protein [Thermoanaerobaculia bacterium]HUM30158.1 hypothetical protein [Thermoanaerobaculia bacterium]HXK68392.1 hypothetical protein [Thermoanaerobaculia bacterium]